MTKRNIKKKWEGKNKKMIMDLKKREDEKEKYKEEWEDKRKNNESRMKGRKRKWDGQMKKK